MRRVNALRMIACAPVAAILSLAAVSQRSAPTSRSPDPIIFVHGNGDDASRWVPVIWLFESNGYPADRLFAIRFHDPVARVDDTRDEPNRSSTTESMEQLSRFVHATLDKTHAQKVVLIGSSRGGLTIRNYVQNGNGKPFVSAEILCGTPNHGVNASDTNPGGEFNGRGTFLSALNKLSNDGTEVTAGVRTLTLRSDRLDKYAQPTGISSGHPEMQTGVSFESPALKGAENTVLPGKDHRELAFSNEAFAAMYRFVTGSAPKTLTVKAEREPLLSGVITGFAGMAATNDPVPGVRVRVSELSATGLGRLVYDHVTDASGSWGPLRTNSQLHLSFDLESSGRHVVYFLPPLQRSTALLNFRLLPTPATADGGKTGSFLVLRPDGYFSSERDSVLVDGTQAAAEPKGLPIRDSFQVETPDAAHVVEVRLREEDVLVKPSTNQQKSMSIVEFLR